MKHLFNAFSVLLWITGIVIAKGPISTFFAIILPIYSWYLVMEKILIYYNFI